MAIDLDYLQDEIREMNRDGIATREDHAYRFFQILMHQDTLENDIWLSKQCLEEYAGKWVLCANKKIVAHKNLEIAERKAEEKFRIPLSYVCYTFVPKYIVSF